MLAILLGLQTFAKDKSNTHQNNVWPLQQWIWLVTWGHVTQILAILWLRRLIWEWCTDHKIWLSAAHIPVKQNRIADFESPRNQRASEWRHDKASLICALERLDFKRTWCRFFASRMNHQFPHRVLHTRPRGCCHRCISAWIGPTLIFMLFLRLVLFQQCWTSWWPRVHRGFARSRIGLHNYGTQELSSYSNKTQCI